MKHSLLVFAAVPLSILALLPFAAPAQDAHQASPTATKAEPAAAAEPAHGASAPVAAPAASAPQQHGSAPHWDYADASVWGSLSEEFKACSAGMEQSPIDIRVDNTTSSAFEPVAIYWKPFEATFLNNGHTLQANIKDGGFAELGGARYQLLQFHFHAKSEHTIDGKASPMEVHFVHRSKAGKLLVLGVMLEPGAASREIDMLWQKIPASGEEIAVAGKLDALNLLPGKRTSFRYAGSLTTPPCSEIVTWNVFTDPVTLSNEQIGTYTAVYADNARPVQPVNRRFVLNDIYE